MVLFFDKAEVNGLITMDDALVSVRLALAAQGAGRAQNGSPPTSSSSRSGPEHPSGSLQMTATIGTLAGARGWLCAKLSLSARGSEKAWMLLFDDTGTLRCLLVANRLGQLRTGAAAGVSTDVLARADAHVLACLGAGFQAWTQIEAVTRVRRIQRLVLWNRSPKRVQEFTRRARTKLGLVVAYLSYASGRRVGR